MPKSIFDSSVVRISPSKIVAMSALVAAHVETDEVADAGELAQRLGGNDTGSRAGHDRPRRVAPGALGRGDSARGLHDENLAGVALVMEALGELIHVASDDRLQIRR